jgi:hypothetical protein
MHYCFETVDPGDHTHKIDVAEFQQCIASVRESRREAPPEYAAVVEPGSWVVEMDKCGGDSMFRVSLPNLEPRKPLPRGD